MPVLKTLKNGVWEPVSGMSEHTHTKNDITDLQEKVYTQPDEPVDAPVGAVWVDTDEDVGFGSAGGMVAPDLDAAEGESGYIKNRTHYRNIKRTTETYFSGTIKAEELYQGAYFFECNYPFLLGEVYTVKWNNVDYECICRPLDYQGFSGLAVGNLSYLGGEGNNEPFIIASISATSYVIMPLDGQASAEVEVKGIVVNITYYPLDYEYLPNEYKVGGFTSLTDEELDKVIYLHNKGVRIKGSGWDELVSIIKVNSNIYHVTYIDGNGDLNIFRCDKNNGHDYVRLKKDELVLGNYGTQSNTNYSYVVVNGVPELRETDTQATLWAPGVIFSNNNKYMLYVDSDGTVKANRLTY